MALSKKIQKEVEGLELKIETLERNCEFYREQTRQLSEELGMARMEAETANKRIDKLEEENAKLKEQLALMESTYKSKLLVAPSTSDGLLQEMKHNGEAKALDYGNDPTDIFPEDVWRMVFDRLKDPKDLKSCYETCTMFQTILQDKKQIFLFPEVLPILTANALGLRRPQIMKNCRLVCHGWNQSVNNFIQSEYLKFSPERFQDPSYTPIRFDSINNPWNNGDLQLCGPGYNPVPSGYLTYREGGLWFGFQTRGLRSALRSFLTKFGSYIFGMKVEFYDDEASEFHSRDCYKFLCECLSMMPNLQMLYISHPISQRRDEYSEDDDGVDKDDEEETYYFESGHRIKRPTRRSKLRWLNAGIQKQPCPHVSSLKIIYFEKCPSSLIRAILMSNSQVEKMMIKYNFGKDSDDLFSLKLDKLQEVSLIGPQSLQRVTWKLQKLSLNMEGWTTVFRNVCKTLEQSFWNSLEELNWMMDYQFESMQTLAGARLNLPKLKKLSLRLFGKDKSLDFILPMVGLEELSVDLVIKSGEDQSDSDDEAENGDEGWSAEALGIIRFRDYIPCLGECNVWHLLPKLKKIRARERSRFEKNLKWECCTRDEASI